MKNKKISMLLLCFFTLLSQFVYAAVESNPAAIEANPAAAESNHEYHIKIMACSIEQTMRDSINTLRDYSVGSDGSHKYEVIFPGINKKHYYRLNICEDGENGNICEPVGVYEEGSDPLRTGEVVWKLTAIVNNNTCKPELAEVVIADNGDKEFAILLPEIQIRLDPSQSDSVDKLIITSNSPKAIEVVGFFDKKGNRINNFEFEGPTTIDVNNPSLMVKAKPAITYMPKDETYIANYKIKYKIDGEEKTLQISITYYNDMDESIIIPNKAPEPGWFQRFYYSTVTRAAVVVGTLGGIVAGGVYIYKNAQERNLYNQAMIQDMAHGGQAVAAFTTAANAAVAYWIQNGGNAGNIPVSLINQVAQAMGWTASQAKGALHRIAYHYGQSGAIDGL